MLSGLKALHSSRHVFGPRVREGGEWEGRIGNPELALQDAVHPVVLTHPRTRRKGLYVNPNFTLRFEGWGDEEDFAALCREALSDTVLASAGAVGPPRFGLYQLQATVDASDL